MSYCFYHYDDVKNFVRTNPKRCSLKTPGGIPCEYYTVPRTNKNKPKGYTPYSYRYDLNHDGILTRIGIRLPKYEAEDGTVTTEEFDIIEGKFGGDALEKLHVDYTNTDLTYEQFKSMYPLGPYATRDAYWTLRQYYPQGVPKYPLVLKNLWLIQTEYKKETITFCLECSLNNMQSLIDVLVTPDDYSQFAHYIKHRRHTDLNICTNSNLELYQLLRNTFPKANFCYDVYHLSVDVDRVAKKLPAANRRALYNMKTDMRKKLNQFFQSNGSDRLACCRYTREFLHEFKNMVLPEPAQKERDDFLSRIETIEEEYPNFIDDYFEQPAFHQSLPQELIKKYQYTISKPGGFGCERLAYIMLSLMRKIESGNMLTKLDIYDDLQFHSMHGIALNRLFTRRINEPTYNQLALLEKMIKRL